MAITHNGKKLEKRRHKADMYKVKVFDLAQGKYEASLREEEVRGRSRDTSKYDITIFSDKVAKCTCEKC